MSKAFHDQTFAKRFQTMGDLAENVYMETKPLGNTTRFGFRRPKGVKFGTFPEALRHMPDMVTASYLVEVMGLGKDGILKSMKTTKYEALKEWQKFAKRIGLLGLVLFVWNSARRQYVVLPWEKIVKEVAYSKRKHDGPLAFENDGNEYYPLEWERLVDAAEFVGDYHD